MASPLQITDKLLAATGHGTIDQFIRDHDQLTDAELRLELFKATGLEYDRRTVQNWRRRYGA